MASIVTSFDDNHEVVRRHITITDGKVEIELTIDYTKNHNGEVTRCATTTL